MHQELTSKTFNLYIHGTNSNILTFLPLTNFSLLSIPEMIKNYGVAPFSGEVDGGGLDHPLADCRPCFGVLHLSDDINPGNVDRVREFNSKAYNLDRILRSYARDRQISREKINSLLKCYLLEEVEKRDFIRVNILLYYLVLAGQMGIELDQILPLPEQVRLIDSMLLQIRFYYLVKIILKYFKPLKKISYRDPEYRVMRVQLAEELNLPTLLRKITASPLNFKAICDAPTEDQLNLVLNLIKTTDDQKCFLTLKTPEEIVHQHEDQVVPTDPWMYYMSRNESAYGLIPLLLDMIVNDGLDSMFLCRLDLDLDELIAAFECHMATLRNVLQKHRDSDFIILQPLENPFPIVLVVEYSSTALKLFNSSTQEHRAVQALTLGKEIKLIATNSITNAIKLFEFLERYELIDRVGITLFSDLQRCKISNQPPLLLNKQDLKLALHKKSFEHIQPVQTVLRAVPTKTTEPSVPEELTTTTERLRSVV